MDGDSGRLESAGLDSGGLDIDRLDRLIDGPQTVGVQRRQGTHAQVCAAARTVRATLPLAFGTVSWEMPCYCS